MNSALYRAIAKSVFGRLSIYIVQFASLAIYARIFTPQQFGIIASIQVFVIFFQMLSDVGIGPAIINEKDFGKEKRNGIFSVTALLGVFLAIVFYFFSFVLNKFYDGFEYQEIAVLVCIAIFFNALLIIPTTALIKDTKFLQIAKAEIVVELLVLSIIYMLYLMDYGLLALASKSLIQSGFKFVFLWFLSENSEIGRPKLGKELFHIKSILKFSLYQFGFNFINYFSRNLDNILIAKYFGMTSIGLYEKSYQLMRYPLMVTTFAMTPAIQPVLTKVRGDVSKIIEEHNLLTSRLLAISLPISAFLYVNSHNLVMFLFGDSWELAVPLIKIFSFMIPIQAVLSTAGAFFQVLNQPRLLFISGCLSALMNVTAIVWGVTTNEVVFVAIALVFSFSVNYFQCYWLLFRFGFCESILTFLYLQLKVLLISLLPIIVFCVFNTIEFEVLGGSYIFDIIFSGLKLTMSILIFYIPLSRVLKLDRKL